MSSGELCATEIGTRNMKISLALVSSTTLRVDPLIFGVNYFVYLCCCVLRVAVQLTGLRSGGVSAPSLECRLDPTAFL